MPIAISSSFTFPSYLTCPSFVAVPLLSRAVSGNDLFVTSFPGTVGEYDANTGNVINANFITGLGDSIVGLDVASVPEPSTWAMIAVGGAALLGIMLRKKHRSA
jgi:PEP-CTERM motif